MIHWEPEGHKCHRLCTAIAPLLVLNGKLHTVLMPFWLSADDVQVGCPKRKNYNVKKKELKVLKQQHIMWMNMQPKRLVGVKVCFHRNGNDSRRMPMSKYVKFQDSYFRLQKFTKHARGVHQVFVRVVFSSPGISKKFEISCERFQHLANN